jgi:hypothetical protein
MICVSNDELRDITIGNHYEVRGVISDPDNDPNTSFYCIMCDDGQVRWKASWKFMSIEDYRDKVLNKLFE